MWPGVDAVDRAVQGQARPSGRATAKDRSVPNGSSVAAGRTPCSARAGEVELDEAVQPPPEPPLLELPVQGRADLALRLGRLASSVELGRQPAEGRHRPRLVRLRHVARADQLADHGLQHGVHEDAAVGRAEGQLLLQRIDAPGRRARAGRSS